MHPSVKSLSICIPTYKRPRLLGLLVEDILKQSMRPDYLIIVDGDPGSNDVLAILSKLKANIPLTYIPSNHGNLAYQRYLGWRVAAKSGADAIVYFDDDERLIQKEVLEWLIKPLNEPHIVGVGCRIRFSDRPDGSDASLARRNSRPSKLVSLLGSGRKVPPGGLTPTGHRRSLEDTGEDYREVKWLRGGVMAYRMAAVSEETFSADLFALYEKRIGRAEDTFLSRRVGAQGIMLYTFRAVVDHPNADAPKAYSADARKFAYAATYSRRFLNDHYRVYDPPTRSDRWALVKSYAGNVLLAWLKVASKPSKLHFALARGTTLGAIHGLTRPPTAKRLTPHIDWWADAEAALANVQIIQHGTEV